MAEHDAILERLSRSDFRRRFRLGRSERAQFARHGLVGILEHGRGFIETRLAPAEPPDDGKQTPMRGHPIFIAQHATATCCRGCLRKWHGIEPGQTLTDAQIDDVLSVIAAWLRRQTSEADRKPRQGRLF